MQIRCEDYDFLAYAWFKLKLDGYYKNKENRIDDTVKLKLSSLLPLGTKEETDLHYNHETQHAYYSMIVKMFLSRVPLGNVYVDIRNDDNYKIIHGEDIIRALYYYQDEYFALDGDNKAISYIHNEYINNKFFSELSKRIHREYDSNIINTVLIHPDTDEEGFLYIKNSLSQLRW